MAICPTGPPFGILGKTTNLFHTDSETTNLLTPVLGTHKWSPETAQLCVVIATSFLSSATHTHTCMHTSHTHSLTHTQICKTSARSIYPARIPRPLYDVFTEGLLAIQCDPVTFAEIASPAAQFTE